MPTPQQVRVTPQRTNGIQKQPTSLLDRIRPLTKRELGLKVSLYGRPKSGKTRLACTFPKPLLIIGFEDGTQSVVGTKDAYFIQLNSTEEFDELVKGPIAKGEYDTVVVDNATRMRDMRLAEIAGLKDIPVQKEFAMFTRDHYRDAANALKELLSRLLDLSNKTQMNTVIIAQEANLTADDGKQSDLIKPTIGSALGKSLCDFVNAECDYVCQTFIREQMETIKTTINGKDVPITQPTGKNEYCLRVGTHSVYYTGFRQHITAPELPEALVNPTYEKILKLIKG